MGLSSCSVRSPRRERPLTDLGPGHALIWWLAAQSFSCSSPHRTDAPDGCGPCRRGGAARLGSTGTCFAMRKAESIRGLVYATTPPPPAPLSRSPHAAQSSIHPCPQSTRKTHPRWRSTHDRPPTAPRTTAGQRSAPCVSRSGCGTHSWLQWGGGGTRSCSSRMPDPVAGDSRLRFGWDDVYG
jgi:hypothetical protein